MKRIMAQIKAYDLEHDGQVVAAALMAASALLLLVFWAAIHLPLQEAVQEYQSEADKSAQEIIRIGNFQNAHLDYKKFAAELADREKRASSALPDEIDQAGAITEIERMAWQNHMQLHSIKPEKIVREKGAECLPVRIGLTGSYFDLLKFMRELRNGDRLAMVHNVSIKAESGQLDAELAINIFAVPAK